MVQKESGRIVATAFAPGAVHDFALFKTSRLCFEPSVELRGDRGYQGVTKWHANARTPHKKSKKQPLCPQQKQENTQLSKERIKCENVLAQLKRFRILLGPYRNRTRRFALRFILIAALHNLHL